MPTSSPWPTIHAERKALATDLEALTDDQWATPSLCEGWTVRQALAHMTAAATSSPMKFFTRLVGSGFRFDAMGAKDIEREQGSNAAETLARFKDAADLTSAPPGPVVTWLGETIVHSTDIRRPLGIAHGFPVDALVGVANFYKGSNLLIGAKKRIADLHVRATDADWSTGEGAEVEGPLLSLIMAMTGRTAVLGDLSGDGVATLAARS